MRVRSHITTTLALAALAAPTLRAHAEDKKPEPPPPMAKAVPTPSPFALPLFNPIPAAPADAAAAFDSPPRIRFPRVELFLGYSYWRATPTLAPGNRMVWLNGGSASLALNLNRFFGIVADFGGYDDSQLYLTGPGAIPNRVAASGGNAFTYMAGPRLSYRAHERLTPFAQVLVGAAHASAVTLSNCTGTGCTPLPSQTSLALTAGAGLDLKLRRHLALRIVQAEYLMTRFPDPTTAVKNAQNNVRLSAGLVFRSGGAPPPPPVSYACSANPPSVYPGDPITFSGTPLNLNPKSTPTYTWTADAGRITGSSATANLDTSGTAPGSYLAHGHVAENNKPESLKAGHFADCSAPYTIMPFQPPTVSCSANPSSLRPGDSATITAQAVSPQNRPLTYSYTASQGSIQGSTANATLTTSSATSGSIVVTCNVVDDKGQTASATAELALQTPLPPPAPLAPTTQKLCSISFARDLKRPTRVDNEAKACLDDVALNLQRSSDSKLAVIGDTDTGSTKYAAQRVANTKDYLVRDKGIDASRISVYTGAAGSKSVDLTLIPTGAAMDTSGLQPAGSVAPIDRRKK